MNNENFLPENYKVPDNSGYMKLAQGENTFRVMSSAIVGYEYWTNESKPVRSEKPFKSTPNIKLDKDGNPTKIKHFWAFIVWNYNTQSIQILELTQSSIQGAIKAMVDNKKWGAPTNYDITISKVGDGLDTEYSVMPNPHSDITEEMAEARKSLKIDLTALYRGDSPFEAQNAPTGLPGAQNTPTGISTGEDMSLPKF